MLAAAAAAYLVAVLLHFYFTLRSLRLETLNHLKIIEKFLNRVVK